MMTPQVNLFIFVDRHALYCKSMMNLLVADVPAKVSLELKTTPIAHNVNTNLVLKNKIMKNYINFDCSSSSFPMGAQRPSW